MLPEHKLICFACNSEMTSLKEVEEHSCPPGNWRRNQSSTQEHEGRRDPPIGDRIQTGFRMMDGLITF